MKKSIYIILSLLLVAALTFSGCGLADKLNDVLNGNSGKTPQSLEEIMGTNDGSVYKNDYLGLEFTAPGDWRLYSDEEIAASNAQTSEFLEEAGSELDVGASYYDMMGMDEQTGNNINCILEIVDANAKVDYDEILDEVEKSITDFGEEVGFVYTFGERSEIQLCGITFQKYTAEVDLSGLKFRQAGYITVKDGVMVNISVTIMNDMAISDVEACFK